MSAPRPIRPKTLRTAEELIAVGLAAPDAHADLASVAQRYAVAVTPEMAATITPGNVADPMALQFLPDPRELIRTEEERDDPIADNAFTPTPGLVHRYPDRVLLKATLVCPVYCRFCFRREMVGPGKATALSVNELAAALAYIAARPEIFEVILTGGDPFVLSIRRIREITQALAKIAHVKVIRWHTRVPTVDPARVTPALARALRAPGKAVYVALHANHPREFTPQAETALATLADAGIALVSQSVLLKGVNDDIDTLDALMRAFVKNRVKPYYLHHTDLAPGTSHFRVSIRTGQALMRELHARASGLCVPTYVLDAPDGMAKVPLNADNVRDGVGGIEIRGGDGVWRPYPDTE